MKLRYEEYSDTLGQVPFILMDNIERTAILCSESQNWHENVEIQFCKEGEGTVLIDGSSHAFSSGDLALIDSGAIHYTCSNTRMVYSCIIVSTDFCKQIGLDYHRLSFTPVLKNEALCERFEKICTAYYRKDPLRIARLTHLLLALLIEIADGYASVKYPVKTEQRELAIVKSVLLYIRENYHTKITLDAIAGHVLMDKFTLCKIFKKNTGQTIFENINTYRCMSAAEYITRGKAVCEAARLCGFENNSFFTKTFKRYMGVLPSEFRGAREISK